MPLYDYSDFRYGAALVGVSISKKNSYLRNEKKEQSENSEKEKEMFTENLNCVRVSL